MGRYYRGDIEGNFWFAVQSSDDALFFGGTMFEPNYIEYHFGEKDIENIESGLTKCKAELGEYKEKLDKFFDKLEGYNDEMIATEFEISVPEVKNLLTWYARLELGEKIYECVKEDGSCNFEADC
jgi:hypothetical protein